MPGPTGSGASTRAKVEKAVRTSLWILNVIAVSVLSFLGGYVISSKTGVEPGFFEAAETGGYGAGASAESAEGLSDEYDKYYKNLSK